MSAEIIDGGQCLSTHVKECVGDDNEQQQCGDNNDGDDDSEDGKDSNIVHVYTWVRSYVPDFGASRLTMTHRDRGFLIRSTTKAAAMSITMTT